MENITQEISQLQSRLSELEKQKNDNILKQKQEELEYRKEKDIMYGLVDLKNVLDIKKDNVAKNNYSRSCIVAKFQDIDIIPALESIYNALHMINHRLDKLEQIEDSP